MDADELLRQLTASLAQSLQQLAEKRNETDNSIKYAELTGRMDTITSIVSFIQQTSQAGVPTPETPAPVEAKKAKSGKKTAKTKGKETK